MAKRNPTFHNTNLRDYHVKAALEMGFYLLSGGQGSVPDPGLVWAQENAVMFHDYLQLQATKAAVIGSEDTGLLDVGPNEINGVPLGSIVACDYLGAKGIKDTGDDCISVDIDLLEPFLQQDFEISMLVAVGDDGQVTSGSQLFGAITTNTSNNRQKLNAFIQSNGILGIQMGVGGGQMNWSSSAAVFADGENGLFELRIAFNFTANTLTVTRYDYYNDTESAVAGSFAGASDNINISAIDPANLNLSHDFYIGSTNNIGTTLTNTNYVKILRFAITGLSPDETFVTYFRNIGYAALFESLFNVTPTTATTRRNEIRTAIFGSSTLPSNATPSASAEVTTGTIHGLDVDTDLTAHGTITSYTWVSNGVTNIDYLIEADTPNGELIFWSKGHSLIDDDVAINTFNTAGYAVVFVAMADTGDAGDDSDNTVSGGPWTPSGTNNHNEMAGLGASGLQYMLFDKIMMLNYIEANLSYTNYYVGGVSGGGWTAAMLMALDTRFEKGFCDRGAKPAYFRPSAGDWEQGPNMDGSMQASDAGIVSFFNEHTWFQIFALASQNRFFKIITHVNDSVGLGGNSFLWWESEMQAKATELGGTYELFLNTNGGEATHLVYASEVAEITEDL